LTRKAETLLAVGQVMEQEDRDRLMRIQTKLDAALAVDKDHEGCLRAVEGKQWWLAGAAAAGMFIVTKLPWTMHIG
jgi:hypothetical protein